MGHVCTKPAIMDYVPSKLYAQLSSDLQDRIQAIKLPPALPEPAEVLFPVHMQERVQAISLPPEMDLASATQGQAAKQPFDMSPSKEKLTERSELRQPQDPEQTGSS